MQSPSSIYAGLVPLITRKQPCRSYPTLLRAGNIRCWISIHLDAKLKAKDKEIAKLNKRLENANSTKNSQGAQPGGAKSNKSTEHSTNCSSKKHRGRNLDSRADAAANDTLAVSSPRGQSKSTETQQGKRGNSRRQRRGSSRASRRN